MAKIVKSLTARRVSTLMFLSSLIIIITLLYLGRLPVYLLVDRFESALPSIIALSVSLIIFPFVSVSAVESIVARAEKTGVRMNPNLVKDYLDGCYTIFLLSAIEMILVITYSLSKTVLLLILALSLLPSLVIVLILIVVALWNVTLLLQNVVSSKKN